MDVASPLPSHTAKQRSLPVPLVFRATLEEVEKADGRFFLVLFWERRNLLTAQQGLEALSGGR